MGFGMAIATGFSKYVEFQGRASRSDYWYFVLFCSLGSIAAAVVDSGLRNDIGVIGTLWSLGTALPTIALASRRLHDVDRSGWWQLLWCIPIIGWIPLLIWLCSTGTPAANRFG